MKIVECKLSKRFVYKTLTFEAIGSTISRTDEKVNYKCVEFPILIAKCFIRKTNTKDELSNTKIVTRLYLNKERVFIYNTSYFPIKDVLKFRLSLKNYNDVYLTSVFIEDLFGLKQEMVAKDLSSNYERKRTYVHISNFKLALNELYRKYPNEQKLIKKVINKIPQRREKTFGQLLEESLAFNKESYICELRRISSDIMNDRGTARSLDRRLKQHEKRLALVENTPIEILTQYRVKDKHINYVVDFVIKFGKKLVLIEYDETHHKYNKLKDSRRTRLLIAKLILEFPDGVELLRVNAEEELNFFYVTVRNMIDWLLDETELEYVSQISNREA